jgi:tellurite resistance protein TerC
MVWVWIGFIVFILAMLALDLGVLNRGAHVISAKQALGWTAFWVSLALLFNVAVYFIYEDNWMGFGAEGRALAERQAAGETLTKEEQNLRRVLPGNGGEAAIQFFLGYLVEESLSLDNIFVMAVIFAKFRVPAKHQHRVLFWGIIGAQVMRGIMIGLGSALIAQAQWVTYIFGAFLIYTAFKMYFSHDEEADPENSFLVRWARKIYPVTPDYVEGKFFVQWEGKRAMTPLFLVLLVIEGTDLLFAVDSVPAVFGITQDPFLVFTSNIFAILGLRSMYFALAAVLEKFRYLKYSLVFLLAFIGIKMLLVAVHFHFTPVQSLGIIGGILGAGVLASILIPEKKDEEPSEAPPSDEAPPAH